MLILAKPHASPRTRPHRAVVTDRVAALPEPSSARQAAMAGVCVGTLFALVAMKLAALAWEAEQMVTAAMAEPVTVSYSRPDIVDRKGRLLATDVEVHSLYADPSRVIDADEAVEKLRAVLPDLDDAELRKALNETSRHFVWVRRGLTPRVAQVVHDLGLPGFAFRKELRRAYPLGALAGHIVGRVDADNRGVAGIESYIDATIGIDPVHATRPTERAPVRLAIDVGLEAGLEAELADAMARYRTAAAAAIVMDAHSGEIVAAASLPGVEPARAADVRDMAKRDRLQSGTYELGSIFKMMTIAMALDRHQATLDTMVDVRVPLSAGRFTIRDLHPSPQPLSVTGIFLHSSNVGAGLLALEAGSSVQRDFLSRMGLLSAMTTEAGPVASPRQPEHWERAETITISYGHGLAVAPLQFAAAAAALVNGGLQVTPTYLKRKAGDEPPAPVRLVSEPTSAAIRTLMRLNVTDPVGTGHRADVEGYEIGGKTGTADIAGARGYHQGGVIASFLAAFPMRAPRYVALVMLFEPKASAETGGTVLAGRTAAPVAANIVRRIGPLLP